MSIRVALVSPEGERVVRDIVAGRWAEPSGSADTVIGEGSWALPGLSDAHAHLAAAELDFVPGILEDAVERARSALQAGVTLILDKGWGDDTTIRLIDWLPPDERPEIEAAARIISVPDGYFPGFGLQVTKPQLESAVAGEARVGAGWVKLIGDWPRKGRGPVSNFDEHELRSAVKTASAAGARVAIHTYAREIPTMAVAAGVDSIEHGLFLEVDDLEALGQRGGMWVPTVLRTEATLHQLGAGSSGGRLFAEGLERLHRLLPLGVEAGVHVLAGTDLVGTPAQVAAEALRLAEYGLTSSQVVAAVSTAAFKATGRGSGFAVGTPADAVLFPANPRDELGVLAHPGAVIRLGRVQ